MQSSSHLEKATQGGNGHHRVKSDLRKIGWAASVDEGSGLVYLFNTESGESKWADGSELHPYSVSNV